MCLVCDVTQKRTQALQFHQSQKMEALGQFAGGIAHDFNNILSIIDGYTRMALKTVEKEEKTYDCLERIKQASRRGANLTGELLTFGRHGIVSENVVDVGEIIKKRESTLRSFLGASVNLVVSADIGMCVNIASDSILQVLTNLVANARDAMPGGGTVTVEAHLCENSNILPAGVPEAERNGKFVCLSVTDTGTGMDMETKMRIFDPFFTTKEQGSGAGLGLSMVYGIVNQAGGYIDVKSSLGNGTSMRVYFPLSERRPQVKRASRTQDNAAGLEFDGYTALVAEDEGDLLFVVTSMLEDMGMQVISAKNGNEALLKQDDFKGEDRKSVV